MCSGQVRRLLPGKAERQQDAAAAALWRLQVHLPTTWGGRRRAPSVPVSERAGMCGGAVTARIPAWPWLAESDSSVHGRVWPHGPECRPIVKRGAPPSGPGPARKRSEGFQGDVFVSIHSYRKLELGPVQRSLGEGSAQQQRAPPSWQHKGVSFPPCCKPRARGL